MKETAIQDDSFYNQEMWDDAMSGVIEYENEIKAPKDKYKAMLKNLCNVKRIWEWLDENDSWQVDGIFNLSIEYKMNTYYNRMMPHARVIDQTLSFGEMHWQKGYSDNGCSHYFVRQTSCYEDSYSGTLAIPLRDHRYLIVTYSC